MVAWCGLKLRCVVRMFAVLSLHPRLHSHLAEQSLTSLGLLLTLKLRLTTTLLLLGILLITTLLLLGTIIITILMLLSELVLLLLVVLVLGVVFVVVLKDLPIFSSE